MLLLHAVCWFCGFVAGHQFDVPNNNSWDTNVTSATHSHMARVLAAQGVVLLKNDPLQAANHTRLSDPLLSQVCSHAH